MRAETVEIQREDAGRLLAPMVHVERNIARQTTIISVEVPDKDVRRCQTAREFRALVKIVLTSLGDSFMAAWESLHQEQP